MAAYLFAELIPLSLDVPTGTEGAQGGGTDESGPGNATTEGPSVATQGFALLAGFNWEWVVRKLGELTEK